MYHLDALFLTQVYLGHKFCPSVLETVTIPVPARYVRDVSFFSVCPAINNCPAKCAAAANVICRDFDTSGTRKGSHNHILLQTLYFQMCWISVPLSNNFKHIFFFSHYLSFNDFFP
jgi:hypothetical protein